MNAHADPQNKLIFTFPRDFLLNLSMNNTLVIFLYLDSKKSDLNSNYKYPFYNAHDKHHRDLTSVLT